jgi:hypothetical protein
MHTPTLSSPSTAFRLPTQQSTVCFGEAVKTTADQGQAVRSLDAKNLCEQVILSYDGTPITVASRLKYLFEQGFSNVAKMTQYLPPLSKPQEAILTTALAQLKALNYVHQERDRFALTDTGAEFLHKEFKGLLPREGYIWHSSHQAFAKYTMIK